MAETNWFLMASVCIHEEEFGKVIKFLHPNLVSNIKR